MVHRGCNSFPMRVTEDQYWNRGLNDSCHHYKYPSSIVTDLLLPHLTDILDWKGIIFHFRDSDPANRIVVYCTLPPSSASSSQRAVLLALALPTHHYPCTRSSRKKDGVDVTESTSESFEKVIHLGGFKSRKAKKTISRPRNIINQYL